MRHTVHLLALALALTSATCIFGQSSGSQGQPAQGQDPAGQQPTQPTQPQEPAKQEGDKSYEEHLPTPPVVAGTSNDAPLTGASQPIIGLVASRSYIAPSVYYYGQLDTNGDNTLGTNHFASVNTLMGSLAVQKVGRASQLNFGYLAGRSFSNEGGLSSTTQEAAASELWSRGRWDGFILDKLLYSSQSALLGGVTPFDATGLNTVSGLAEIGPVILRNSFVPEQGIFTAPGPRLSNALVGQVNNHLSRRLFFTAVGNYSVLHFYNSAPGNLVLGVPTNGLTLINSSEAGFQTGLGYQRSRRDTFAVVYRFNDLWFTGFPVSVRDNVVEGAYQREVGERLILQVGAGPEISFIHDPNLAGGGSNSNTRVSWTLDGVGTYQITRGLSISAGYDHFLSSGSGIFLGAITDRAFVRLNRHFSRVWTLDITGSYAHNRNLVPVVSSATAIAPANASFDSVYGGVELRRRVGRESEVFFGYLGRYQTSNFILCPQGICQSSNLVGHQFNFGFAWHIKPVPIG